MIIVLKSIGQIWTKRRSYNSRKGNTWSHLQFHTKLHVVSFERTNTYLRVLKRTETMVN